MRGAAVYLADNGLAFGRTAAGAGGQGMPQRQSVPGRFGRPDELARARGDGAPRDWLLALLDHFCRMAEVIETLRGLEPMGKSEAAPLRKLLGVEDRRSPVWKRMFGGK